MFTAPKRSDTHGIFEGVASPENIASTSGVSLTFTEHEGYKRLRHAIDQATVIYTKLPAVSYYRPAGLQLNGAQHRLIQKLRRSAAAELCDITPALTKLRLIKQPAEIEALRQAITITAEALNKVTKQLDTYASEQEIAADITHHYMHIGATHGYEPIVASGSNACTLHYVRNNQILTKGQLVLIDSGAEYLGYSADITRTLAFGRLSDRHIAIHQAVTSLQQEAFTLFRPGTTLKEVERIFLPRMSEVLKQLSLIKPDQEDARQYYPHALSHFLGLDVHDVGASDTVLAPGMVLTVEPGIYVPEEGIGVRIEDNIVITDAGSELLSAECLQPTLS